METLLDRIYRLKLLAVGALLVALGLLASILSDWLSAQQSSHLIIAATQGLSDVLVVTGGFGIAIDFFTGRDKEAADTERTRTVLRELTPDFTDAVVRGFAASPDDLTRVATPELLDALATNALTLRLGNRQFAEEIYTDIRDQAIRAPERWYDVKVTVRLSTAVERNGLVPLFDVLVDWEYTTAPTHPIRRFASVSDRDEYDDLMTDVPATLTWFMSPDGGLRAGSMDAFELVYFSVDGEERPIRRSERRSGQTYSANVGAEVLHAEKPVRIRHVYRVQTRQSGHYLFLEIPQPARGVSIDIDYSATEIAALRVTNLVSAASRTRIERLPKQSGVKSMSIDHPGWVLPRAGVAIAWTLSSEDDAAATATASRST